VFVGYNDSYTYSGQPDVGAFKATTSLGTDLGDQGFFWVSYDAVKNIGNNLLLTYMVEGSTTVNNTTDLGSNGGNDTNATSDFTTADYWVLHWYYPAMVLGGVVAVAAAFTRHWLIMILGAALIVFSYLYMTSAGVLLGWLTRTGL
jgi:hypothetical protein